MMTLTHRIVTLEVRQRLIEDLGIFLPKKYLIWGSVRPDFVKHRVSHFKDENVELFYEKWDRLCVMNMRTHLQDFSVELGEIFHFLCDYFCFAHNDPELSREMWHHLRYENELHKFARREREQVFDLTCADYSLVPFRELIEYKHKLFLLRPQSFENDLQCSFEMCMIVAQKLFKDVLATHTYQPVSAAR